MTVLAYEMFSLDRSPFNFYGGAPTRIHCRSCGKVVDRDYAPADLGRLAYRFDATWSYDGHMLVSQRMRDFISDLCPGSVDFVRINSAPAIYDFRPAEVWRYDLDRFRPGFERRCDSCGLYLVASQPPMLELRDFDEPIEHGIFGVDISFVGGRIERRRSLSG